MYASPEEAMTLPPVLPRTVTREELLAALVFWAVFGPLYGDMGHGNSEEWDYFRVSVPRRIAAAARRAVGYPWSRPIVHLSDVHHAIAREEKRQ